MHFTAKFPRGGIFAALQELFVMTSSWLSQMLTSRGSLFLTEFKASES